MAKNSLKDTVNEDEIIDLGEEINSPNIILEENSENGYGILGEYGDYSLVVKQIAYRSAKEEDNIDAKYKIIKYTNWSPYPCYVSTLLEAINSWIEKRNLTKIRALKKAKFGEVEKIYTETKELVSKAMKILEVADGEKSNAIHTDNYNSILEETQRIKEIIKEADALHELVKEKRQIVIGDTEGKKHRIKKEDY